MAQKKQNLGRDLSVSITMNGVVIQQFGLLTDTHIRPLFTERKVVPTNNGGVTVARAVFNGWECDMTYTRQDGTADTIAQFVQDTYFAGGPDIDVTMQQTVRNTNGSVDVFQYLDGIIYPTDSGSYKGNEDVSGTYKLFFPRRIQLSGSASDATFGGGVIPTVSSLL